MLVRARDRVPGDLEGARGLAAARPRADAVSAKFPLAAPIGIA